MGGGRHAERWVTVVPHGNGTDVRPVQGTEEVLAESEYEMIRTRLGAR